MVQKTATLGIDAAVVLQRLSRTVDRLVDRVVKLEDRVRQVERDTNPHRLAGYGDG